MRRTSRFLIASLIVLGAPALLAPDPASAVAPPQWIRFTGDDRYLTSSTVAVNAFTEGVPVAYVTTGAGFADALTAGPAAAQGDGPVVLTEPNRLHPATTGALGFVQPAAIVVVGGSAVIAPSVVESLEDRYEVPVTRVSGPDRYATSVAVAQHAFPAKTSRVFVASGEGFVDALAAGPAAGDAHAPLLLTRRDDIPDVVMAKITALDPDEIVVVGGTAAVSQAVAAKLGTVAPVVRRAGADRYETAAAVSAALFGKVGDAFPTQTAQAYLVTGENFPDGLSAGAPGGQADSVRQPPRSGPVLLVKKDCIPKATGDELHRLALSRADNDPLPIVVVGGPGVISDKVLVDHTVCPT